MGQKQVGMTFQDLLTVAIWAHSPHPVQGRDTNAILQSLDHQSGHSMSRCQRHGESQRCIFRVLDSRNLRCAESNGWPEKKRGNMKSIAHVQVRNKYLSRNEFAHKHSALAKHRDDAAHEVLVQIISQYLPAWSYYWKNNRLDFSLLLLGPSNLIGKKKMWNYTELDTWNRIFLMEYTRSSCAALSSGAFALQGFSPVSQEAKSWVMASRCQTRSQACAWSSQAPHRTSLHSAVTTWTPEWAANASIAFWGVILEKGMSMCLAIPGRNICSTSCSGSCFNALTSLWRDSFRELPKRLVLKGALEDLNTFINARMRDCASGQRETAPACFLCTLCGRSGQKVHPWCWVVRCCHIRKTYQWKTLAEKRKLPENSGSLKTGLKETVNISRGLRTCCWVISSPSPRGFCALITTEAKSREGPRIAVEVHLSRDGINRFRPHEMQGTTSQAHLSLAENFDFLLQQWVPLARRSRRREHICLDGAVQLPVLWHHLAQGIGYEATSRRKTWPPGA